MFEKDSVKATLLQIPDDVSKYLEHDEFVLPIEATKLLPENAEWTDGAPVTNDEGVFIILPVWKTIRRHVIRHVSDVCCNNAYCCRR